MKLKFIFILLLIPVLIIGCQQNNITENKRTASGAFSGRLIEDRLQNHVDFSRSISKDDVFIYTRSKSSYVVTSNGSEEISNIELDSFNREKNGAIGIKYSGFEGTEKWLNPIVLYDLSSKRETMPVKDIDELKCSNLLSSKVDKLLLNSYALKEERWDIGKGKTYLFDTKTRKYNALNFEYSKNFSKTSVVCADFCGEGYIISFSSVDDNNTNDNGVFTVLTDKNGKTLKYLKPGLNGEKNADIYRTLKASPDGKKFIYSLGSSGANLYLYDIEKDNVTTIAENNVVSKGFGEDSSVVYYVVISSNVGEKINYVMKKYKI